MSQLFNTLIVEDEPKPLEALLRELKPFEARIKVTAIARSYEQARRIILTNKFDLSILDKKLDEGFTCFNLIKNANIANFGIIALNSREPLVDLENLGLFKELPTYILKPYTETTVGDFIKRLNDIEIKKSRKVLLDAGNDGLIPIEEDSIMYIEATGGCSVYHMSKSDGKEYKITISEPLIEQENKLNNTKFIRVHKSYIVNKDKIYTVKKGGRTSGILILIDNSEIYYSMDNHDKILEIILSNN